MEPRYMHNSAGLFEKSKYFPHCTPFTFHGIIRGIFFADHFWSSFRILISLRNWRTRSICELGRHNRRLLTCQPSTLRYLLGRHWAYSNMLNVNINSNLHSEFFCERHHRRCRDVVLFGLGLTYSCSEIKNKATGWWQSRSEQVRRKWRRRWCCVPHLHTDARHGRKGRISGLAALSWRIRTPQSVFSSQ